MSNLPVVFATISTLLVIAIILVGYFYYNKKILYVEHEYDEKLSKLVQQVNTTGVNKYELDVEQNSILQENTINLANLQSIEKQNYDAVHNQVNSLTSTQQSSLASFSNNINALSVRAGNDYYNLNTEIVGLESSLTNMGSTLLQFKNTLETMPISAQHTAIDSLSIELSNVQMASLTMSSNMNQFQSSVSSQVHNLVPSSTLVNNYATKAYVLSNFHAVAANETHNFAPISMVSDLYDQSSAAIVDIQTVFSSIPMTYATQHTVESVVELKDSNVNLQLKNLNNQLSSTVSFMMSNYTTRAQLAQAISLAQSSDRQDALNLQNIEISALASVSSNIMSLESQFANFPSVYLTQISAANMYAKPNEVGTALSNWQPSLRMLYAPLAQYNFLQSNYNSLPVMGTNIIIPDGSEMCIGQNCLHSKDLAILHNIVANPKSICPPPAQAKCPTCPVCPTIQSPPNIIKQIESQSPLYLNTTYEIILSNYFSNATSYTAYSPNGNVTISNNILQYTIMCRNSTYSVSVTSTNASGSIMQSFNIIELLCESLGDSNAPPASFLYSPIGATQGKVYISCSTTSGKGTYAGYGSSQANQITFLKVVQHAHWRTGKMVDACTFYFDQPFNLTIYLFDAGKPNQSVYDFGWNNHWSLSGN